MIILLSFVILVIIYWAILSHVQLPEHSLLVTVEDKLGHFLIICVFLEESLSDEESTHHDDCFSFLTSHDQVFPLIGTLDSKLKACWFFIFDCVALESMIMASICSFLHLDLHKRKPYRLIIIFDKLLRIDRVSSVVN